MTRISDAQTNVGNNFPRAAVGNLEEPRGDIRDSKSHGVVAVDTENCERSGLVASSGDFMRLKVTQWRNVDQKHYIL